jgi:hypothetical protein
MNAATIMYAIEFIGDMLMLGGLVVIMILIFLRITGRA